MNKTCGFTVPKGNLCPLGNVISFKVLLSHIYSPDISHFNLLLLLGFEAWATSCVSNLRHLWNFHLIQRSFKDLIGIVLCE